MLQDYLPLKSITFIVHISERMAEIMEEYKVTIKEEISTVEDTCTVFVAGEDKVTIKEEDKIEKSTENQGMGKHFLHRLFSVDRFVTFFELRAHKYKNCYQN